MKRLEDALQRDVIEYLQTVLPPRWLCFAIPNGSKRDKNGRPANWVPGIVSGIPDICILGRPSLTYFIELKAPKGRVSEAQGEIHDQLTELLHHCRVCRSVDDVQAALALWGVPTREHKHK